MSSRTSGESLHVRRSSMRTARHCSLCRLAGRTFYRRTLTGGRVGCGADWKWEEFVVPGSHRPKDLNASGGGESIILAGLEVSDRSSTASGEAGPLTQRTPGLAWTAGNDRTYGRQRKPTQWCQLILLLETEKRRAAHFATDLRSQFNARRGTKQFLNRRLLRHHGPQKN